MLDTSLSAWDWTEIVNKTNYQSVWLDLGAQHDTNLILHTTYALSLAQANTDLKKKKKDLLCVSCAVWFVLVQIEAKQGWVRAAVTLGSLSAGCEPHILCSVSWMQRKTEAHASCRRLSLLTWWSQIQMWLNRETATLCGSSVSQSECRAFKIYIYVCIYIKKNILSG